MPIVTKKDSKELQQRKKELAEKLEDMRKKDSEPVRGLFRFLEVPGGSFAFSYHKYAGDEIDTFQLVDGEIYNLPYGVAKHLNQNVWYPEYEHIKTEGNVPVQGGYVPGNGMIISKENTMKIGKRIHRTSFQPLDFMAPEDIGITPNLYTVEKLQLGA